MVSETVDLSKPIQEIQDSLEMATSILGKASAEGWSRSTFCKAIGILNHGMNEEGDIQNFVTLTPTINARISDDHSDEDVVIGIKNYNINQGLSEIGQLVLDLTVINPSQECEVYAAFIQEFNGFLKQQGYSGYGLAKT